MTFLLRSRSGHSKGRRLADSVGDYWWYVIKVAPQREFDCQRLFKHKGIITFLPVDRRWRQRSRYTRQKDLKSFPLIPGYVFVGFIPGIPPWYDIFAPSFVKGVLAVNGEPRQVPAVAMWMLIARFEDGLERPRQERYMRTHREFKAGDLVRIVDGPFEGRTVPVYEVRGRKARVFLDLFGATQDVSIDAWMLEAAE